MFIYIDAIRKKWSLFVVEEKLELLRLLKFPAIIVRLSRTLNLFYSPNTKLSGRKSWPNGPLRTESIVPGSRSTRTARGTYFPPEINHRFNHSIVRLIVYQQLHCNRRWYVQVEDPNRHGMCPLDRYRVHRKLLPKTEESNTDEHSKEIVKIWLTLAPIWLPHWPAWIWTISRMIVFYDTEKSRTERGTMIKSRKRNSTRLAVTDDGARKWMQ